MLACKYGPRLRRESCAGERLARVARGGPYAGGRELPTMLQGTGDVTPSISRPGRRPPQAGSGQNGTGYSTFLEGIGSPNSFITICKSFQVSFF
jgi:hypothetical protein